MKTKVTCFYDSRGVLYAFSENKDLIRLFESTRLLRGFTKKKHKMNEMQYRGFIALERDHLMMMNVLTDGVNSFDYVTTYLENTLLEEECEKIYDKVLELERYIIALPFEDSVFEKVQYVIGRRRESVKHEGRFGHFNTFDIFVNKFKESII